ACRAGDGRAGLWRSSGGSHVLPKIRLRLARRRVWSRSGTRARRTPDWISCCGLAGPACSAIPGVGRTLEVGNGNETLDGDTRRRTGGVPCAVRGAPGGRRAGAAVVAVGLKPSERLRQMAMPVWERILAHPYLKELKDGTLPVETFRFYVQQDWLYLQEFTRAAAVIAGRTPDADSLKFMLTWVEPLVGMEYHFHRAHAEELGLDFDHIGWQMNEANWAYSRHMLAAAHGATAAEGLAAMLPCPHVYSHVGSVLRDGELPPNAMYADWIEFYA